MAPSSKVLLKRLGFKVVEVIAGIAVWLAVVHFHPESLKLSAVILGAVVALVLAVHLEGLFLRDEMQDIRRSHGGIAKLADSSDPIDRELLNLALRYPDGKISDSEITEAWRDLSWIFRKDYDATNYIRPNQIYTEAWASPALAVQIAKALSAHGAHIRKVFLVDNETELEDVRKLLNEQVTAGIIIRHSRYSKITTSSLLDGLAKELKSTDFGIFDGRCVLIWNLKDRKVIDGELIFDRKEIKKYHRFFGELLKASTPWTVGPGKS